MPSAQGSNPLRAHQIRTQSATREAEPHGEAPRQRTSVAVHMHTPFIPIGTTVVV